MNTLFNKVLGENEEYVFYFYLKTEGTFWPTQYLKVHLCHNKDQYFIPFYCVDPTTLHLSVHQLMDSWVVSSFWLL